MNSTTRVSGEHFLSGGGEMGALIRAKDWSKTSLGTPDTWSQGLKTSIGIILRSGYPMFVWWGEERIMFHNDAYLPVLGEKHPRALGNKAEIMWSEIWDQVGPMSDKVFKGDQIFEKDLLLFLGRKGFAEETYFTFSYSPILNERGEVGGLFCACNEETGKILGQRRLRALRDISNITTTNKDENEVTDELITVIAGNEVDIPFSALYLSNDESQQIELVKSSGLKTWDGIFPPAYSTSGGNSPWSLDVAVFSTKHVLIDIKALGLTQFNEAITATVKPTKAVAIPLQKGGLEKPIGVIILGISPFLEFNENYQSYFTLLAAQVSAGITSARALEEERKRAKALAEIDKAKTDFYSNLFIQAPVAICILRGKNFVVELANELMLEFWAKTQTEVINKPVFEGVPEAREQGLEQLLEGVYNTGEPFVATGFPVDLKRDNRIETVYVNFVYEALRKADGTIEGIIAVANEVTEHVVARKKVEESEARFKLLADEMPQLIWTSDKTGHLNYFNKAVYKFTGKSLDELKDDNWLSSIHGDEREANRRAWRNSIETGEDFIFEHRFKKYDGEYRWFLSRGLAQRDSKGEIQMWVGSSTDIHDQKIMAEELEKRVEARTHELKVANEELLRTNKELEQFAYVSSHDLQEPLRKIQTFSQMLLSSDGKPGFDSKKYLEKIHNSGQRMSALIKDLLNFSRLSKTDEKFIDTDLNEVLANVIEDFEVFINQKKAVINSSPLPVIKAIPLQINQLFYNLISNSLKFSEQTPVINITAASPSVEEAENIHELEKDRNYLRLVFSDNGIGFDPTYSNKIFTIFQRLNNRDKYSGTGIGLAICKKIVENHSGFITATSELNKGATFTIYLPKDHE